MIRRLHPPREIQTLTPDRRAYTRFDIVGSLWGILELPHSGVIVNASESGILIEADVCPGLDAVHQTEVNLQGEQIQVDTVVRHFHPSPSGRFQIGLEFQKSSSTLREAIERLPAARETKDPEN